MSLLLRHSGWEGRTLGFFEEFRDLSEATSYAAQQLDPLAAVEMSNPVCGDLVRVEIRLEHGRITRFAYQQKGCWPVVGCLELLGRLLEGASPQEVLLFELTDFSKLVLRLPASKRHAFSLTHRAALAAVARALALQEANSSARAGILTGDAPVEKKRFDPPSPVGVSGPLNESSRTGQAARLGEKGYTDKR
jgi:NifU-like protein involved in Fe-S cluster formation